MTVVCPECGVLIEPVHVPSDGDWYDTLFTLSDQIGGREDLEAWNDSHGINERQAEETANAMKACLVYKVKDDRGMWWRYIAGKKHPQGYVSIKAVYYTWVKRNGSKPQGLY